jgi:hypothetical protein
MYARLRYSAKQYPEQPKWATPPFAPITHTKYPHLTQNFLALCASGYYDNTLFHRNIKGFMVQGGDPTGQLISHRNLRN